MSYPDEPTQGILARTLSKVRTNSKSSQSTNDTRHGKCASIDTPVIEKTTDLAVYSSDEPGEVIRVQPDPVDADPFAASSGNAAKYKSLAWWQCGLLLVAETISLGILSLPMVLASLGFLPGILLIVGIGLIATYTGYVLHQVKTRYPQIHSFADAAGILFGRVCQEFVEICQILIFVFLMAAHVLTFAIAMSVLTHNGACSIIFIAVGTVISLLLTIPRTLKNMSHFSAFSCLSILVAVIVTMVGVGITKPGIGSTFVVVPLHLTSLQKGFIGVADIVIAFTGHVTFFGFMSELKTQRDFPKALAFVQIIAISLYVFVAVFIYHFAGAHVTSPALTSASPVIQKAAYGIAIPTIVVAGVINAHVCAKNIYVRIFRKSPEKLHQRSVQSYGTWLGLCVVLWTVGFLIAVSIPVFDPLLGLIGALFCTWYALGMPAIFWLGMNWKRVVKFKMQDFRDRKWTTLLQCGLFAVNVLILAMSCAACVLGTYGSAKSIADHASKGGAFSCRNYSVQ